MEMWKDSTMHEDQSPALLIVDVQNDFCAGGALEVAHGNEVIPVLNRLAAHMSALGFPVYASRDWHPPTSRHFAVNGGAWPVHCVAGTEGARLHPDLDLPPGTLIVSKGIRPDEEGYSDFEGEIAGRGSLLADLRARGVTDLIVGGLATDYCVRATAIDARKEGFGVTVVTDGVRPVDVKPGDGDRALDEKKAAGVRLAPASEAFDATE
jgi:nicotinamidase/pyrazinamidase